MGFGDITIREQAQPETDNHRAFASCRRAEAADCTIQRVDAATARV